MAHIAVVGAGIVGITTTYSLLKRGFRVTAFERHRYPAMETSFANGGQLSASNAEVWNRASTIAHALTWMFRQDAPLLFNPRPSWQKYSWIVEFIAEVRNYKRNTQATVRLALEARKHLFQMAETEGIDFDLERRGILHLYRTKDEMVAAEASNKILNEAGLDRRAVTSEEMFEIEPTLRGKYCGGYYTPSDATGDIHKFTRGLADACVRKGARLLCDAKVRSIDATVQGVTISYENIYRRHSMELAQSENFSAVVVCAGVESRDLAASLGDRINIYPVKGYSITVHLDSLSSRDDAPRVSILDDDKKVVTSRLGDRFRVAGTAEFNGYNRDIRADRIGPLVDWTREHFPTVDTDQVVPWSGLRPMTPSMMPRVGKGRRPNVYYNTGHGHLGWTMAAATSELIADVIAGDQPI